MLLDGGGRRVIYRSPWPSIAHLPRLQVWEFLRESARRLPDHPALIEASGRVSTYQQMWTASRGAAGLFQQELNLGPGDVVALSAEASREFAAAMNGVLMAGGTVLPVSPILQHRDALWQFEESGASLAILSPRSRQLLEELRSAGQVPGIRSTYPLEGVWDAAMAVLEPPRPVTVDVDNDLAFLAFTSGTGGLPKAAMLTHAGTAASIYQRIATSEFGPDSVLLTFGPSWLTLRWCFAAGATAVDASGLDPDERVALCQEHGVTHVLARPFALSEMVRALELRQRDLSALRYLESSGSQVPASLARRAGALFGVPVRLAYTLTETNTAANRPRSGDVRFGSVGPPVPDTEERIVDPDTLDDVPPGELGEILIKGPQVMKGYRSGPPDAAGALLPGGWLRTGDVGRFDPDGNLYLVDRAREMIKTLGRQVSPAEIEAVLLEHPAVRDVAVVPIVSPEAGEFPKAFVVLEPGRTVTTDELIARVASSLAPFKVPREIAFVAELPRGSSGKVLRRFLAPPGSRE